MADRKVALIGLDAAEPEVVRKGVEEGWMPAMAEILRRGQSALLDGSQRLLPGSGWPTLITGTEPDRHMVMNDVHLSPGTYKIVNTLPTHLREPAFWKFISDAGVSSTVVSVYAAAMISDFRGTQVAGWGSHDPYATKMGPPATDPPDLLRRLEKKFPDRRSGFVEEIPETAEEFAAFRTFVIDQIGMQAQAMRFLVERTDWQFFVGSFSDIHEAGHFLWHTYDPACPEYDSRVQARFGDLLKDVYVALDRGLELMLESLPPDVAVCVVTPHGMGVNPRAPEATAPILEAGGWLTRFDSAKDPGIRMRSAVRSVINKTLPLSARRKLGSVFAESRRRLIADSILAKVNWETTSAFPLPTDVTSLVRINLAGREPGGTVQPGDEYEEVLGRIGNAFGEVVHADDGSPAVNDTVRMDREMGGPVGDVLPDLAIVWHEKPLIRISSPLIGTIDVRKRKRSTGEHRPTGYLAGMGPGITPSGIPSLGSETHETVDVAPTVLSMLGVPIPESLTGHVLAGFSSVTIP
ncbi:MAG: alkaline phosphatase family protein [Actinomycetota bacterium]